MIHCPIWHYYPDQHEFLYTANIRWPGCTCEQLDWITGIQDVELWLLQYAGPKYQRWAWHMAQNCYDIGVAFKYDKHRTLFLINYAN
jgi:hypothetical protein